MSVVKGNLSPGLIASRTYEATEINTSAGAGAFEWHLDDDGEPLLLVFVCPCGCNEVGSVPVKTDKQEGWDWNGNQDVPSLTPSIFKQYGCRWHGYLTNGYWRQV